MSYSFPETPILLYPSLIHKLGVEAALLMTLYQERCQRLSAISPGAATELIFSHDQWLALGKFWDEDTLAQLTNELVEAGFIDAAFARDGRVRIQFHTAVALPDEELEVEQVSRLPVMEMAPTAPQVAVAPVVPPYTGAPVVDMQDTPYYPDSSTTPVQINEINAINSNPGPAPTFGGSIGWARKERRGDELQALFQQHEQRNRQLRGMELGWQPSENFFALLPRHNIAPQFAMGCLDEFVLYWLDKDRKESNWDQKFLGWVKREWVKKQTQDGRQQRISNEQQAGFSHENTRRDTREKRQRVTAAVMDIKDTDW